MQIVPVNSKIDCRRIKKTISSKMKKSYSKVNGRSIPLVCTFWIYSQYMLVASLGVLTLSSAFRLPPLNQQKPKLIIQNVGYFASTKTQVHEIWPPLEKDATQNQQRGDPKSFDNFDYMDRWYPVVWVEDLPLDKPTKITLFDEDYAMSKIKSSSSNDKPETDEEKYEVIALHDICPHKAAALTEGRITSTGYFQCAYHGWAFDGKDGSCVEIPQIITKTNTKVNPGSKRAAATAVPAMISQGMVWLFPGGGLEKALLAPPPPTIAEIDDPAFKCTRLVRDFPVDWPILIENIMDPDHGMFAHASPMMDMYTGSPEAPQSIEETFDNNGASWTIVSRTDAVGNLAVIDNERSGKGKQKKNETDEVPLTASTEYIAPSVISLSRRDGENATKFISAFYITPTGTGRSRFMATSIAKSPISVPRWFMHMNINNFLDEDTYLLATQQRTLLSKEAEALKGIAGFMSTYKQIKTDVRQKLFIFRSPSERLQNRLRAFFDHTLSQVPNRKETLLAMGASNLIRQEPLPPRSHVLDRYTQHTQICQDSQDVIRNCRNVKSVSKFGGLCICALKLFMPNNKWVHSVLKSKRSVALMLTMLALLYKGASKLEKEFYFKQDENRRDKQVGKITKNWMDPIPAQKLVGE